MSWTEKTNCNQTVQQQLLRVDLTMSNTLLYCLYPCDFLSVNGSISGWCLIDENTKLNLWPVFRWWRSALKLYYMSKKRCPELWGKTTLHWNCSNSEKNWLSIWRLIWMKNTERKAIDLNKWYSHTQAAHWLTCRCPYSSFQFVSTKLKFWMHINSNGC